MTPSTAIAGASEQRKILFVDDDEMLLDGLRDGLRAYRRQWTMRFVTSGEQALDLLDDEAPDVVVSDLRMPGLDGATLLEHVRERSPSSVRIVLSGHADITMVARAAAAAHRLIAKPCETSELALIIERSCALQEIAARVELDARAIRASALPAIPRLYAEVTELLASGRGGAADIARLIEQDIAMAAKVLQLANSAYFGRRSPTTRVTDAVSYLGTETLRALLLQAETFGTLTPAQPIPGFDPDRLQRHGTRVGRLADQILKDAGGTGSAFTAGLLHDAGLLVLAAQAPQELAEVLAQARHQACPVHMVEQDRYGLTHAELGAHLLTLWGLPHSVTEAVAGHHDPQWLTLPFDAVAAVQIATALVDELEGAPTGNNVLAATPPDEDYLQRAGLSERLTHWRTLAEELV